MCCSVATPYDTLCVDHFLSSPLEKSGYINVDELQARTSLDEAAALCKVALDVKGRGAEVRIDCPFGCSGDHAGRKEVAINTENPQKVFLCHSYGCKFRGNLLTLMHGWQTGMRPSGGHLKGTEFRDVRNLLAGKVSPPTPGSPAQKPTETESPAAEPLRNVPLARSAEAKVRELVTIDDKFVTDVAHMNPAAAAYVRRHPCLSPESMKKWRCGYMPNDGGGDKRGWSLRGSFIYPVVAEDGQILAWVGRDVNYEEKEREFARLKPEERTKEDAPAKHRFPKGFHRGLELFGQQASRLQETGYRDFISQHGIIVVEGFNDVIGLDTIGIPAVGLCSNHMTEEQAAKISAWARQLSAGKVLLLLDCDDPGDDGAKEALWLLAQQRLHVRIGWTKAMHGGRFTGRQPEALTREEWCAVFADVA